MRVVLDTNIVIDYLAIRKPFYRPAAKLMMLGVLKEAALHISFSQLTDIHYIITHGEQKAGEETAQARMKKLLSFVSVVSLGEEDALEAIDAEWSEFADACVCQAARKIKADAIVTRNAKDFKKSRIKCMTCDELFGFLEKENDVVYDFLDL